MHNSIKFAFKRTEKQSTFILFRLFRHKQEQRFLHLLSCLIYCHPPFQQSISVFQWRPSTLLHLLHPQPGLTLVCEKQCCTLLMTEGSAAGCFVKLNLRYLLSFSGFVSKTKTVPPSDSRASVRSQPDQRSFSLGRSEEKEAAGGWRSPHITFNTK